MRLIIDEAQGSPGGRRKGMEIRRIAVVGFGHVGCGVVEALEAAPDMELAGVVLQDDEEIRRACCCLSATGANACCRSTSCRCN